MERRLSEVCLHRWRLLPIVASVQSFGSLSLYLRSQFRVGVMTWVTVVGTVESNLSCEIRLYRVNKTESATTVSIVEDASKFLRIKLGFEILCKYLTKVFILP